MYNKSFPIEKVKIKMHRNVHKRWITHGIIVYINNKHRLYIISIKNTSEVILNYKTCKNKLTAIITAVEKKSLK